MIDKIKTSLCIIKLIKNFPSYFEDHFKLIKNKIMTLYLRNGVIYKIRSGTTDRNVINDIWIHKEYNPKNFEIKDNYLIVDIGGHIGTFSIYASSFNKNGKIYTFEADPENFKLLKENVKINNVRNIEIINKFVSNEKKEIDFYVSKYENKGNSSAYLSNDDFDKIKIESINFKDFLKKNKIETIDFLKIDCEGGEYDILYSLSKNELSKIQKIAMEYHNLNEIKHSIKSDMIKYNFNGYFLKDFLEKNGFEVFLNELSKKRGMLYAKREVI